MCFSKVRIQNCIPLSTDPGSHYKLELKKQKGQAFELIAHLPSKFPDTFINRAFNYYNAKLPSEKKIQIIIITIILYHVQLLLLLLKNLSVISNVQVITACQAASSSISHDAIYHLILLIISFKFILLLTCKLLFFLQLLLQERNSCNS